MGKQWENKMAEGSRTQGARLIIQLVKYLPCKNEDLSSIPPRIHLKTVGYAGIFFVVPIMGRQRQTAQSNCQVKRGGT